MSNSVPGGELSREGNEVASGFHDREAAVRCWRGIVETCKLQDKELADAAGMSTSYFSKVSSGQQGDLLGMVIVIGQTYPTLRRAFVLGLAEIEGGDPEVEAAEQLIHMAQRFIKLRMARASHRAERRRGIA